MLQQIKNEDNIPGHTITRIDTANNWRDLVLFFENAYAVYTVETGWEAGDEEIVFSNSELDILDQMRLDIITQQEGEALLEQQKQEHSRRLENEERKLFKRLRAKYE